MKLTGLDVLDATIQRTNGWLKDLMQELNWSDHRKTYLTLRCVLHTVRDRLPVEDAAFLANQLPMLLRGVYFENWHPKDKPIRSRSREEFLADLNAFLEDIGEKRHGAVRVVQAVFRLLDRKATEGEIEDVQHILPREVQDLWPTTLRAA